MKTISVREMKAKWAEVERQVKAGESFTVLNHGKPSVRIVPAGPSKVFTWDDHLESALKVSGKSGNEAVNADREGRW